MLDMMSYNPGPTRESACKEIYCVFSNNKQISDIYIKKSFIELFILMKKVGWVVKQVG